MKGTNTESVESFGSFLQRLSSQHDPGQNLQFVPAQMNNSFSSPPSQEGRFRNSASASLSLSRCAVSTPSDRSEISVSIVQNAPGVPSTPSFSPWQNGNFKINHPVPTYQPTQVPSYQNTPEAVKSSYSSEGYNGNKLLVSGAGGSGPSDRLARRLALLKLVMDGHKLPEIPCPCGSGPCIVLTSRTRKNPNRCFYKCPATIKCKFFKWCDELHLGLSSQIPLKRTQGCTRSSGRITKPQNTPSKSHNPLCFCKAGPCIIWTMHEGKNKGRKYYACPIMKGYGACKHFEWVDNLVKPPQTENNWNENQIIYLSRM